MLGFVVVEKGQVKKRKREKDVGCSKVGYIQFRQVFFRIVTEIIVKSF